MPAGPSTPRESGEDQWWNCHHALSKVRLLLERVFLADFPIIPEARV